MDEELQIESADPEVNAAEVDVLEDTEEKASAFASIVEIVKRFRLPLIFVLGLILGWFVLGWVIFPVQWSDTDPWDLRPMHQRWYVRLVAEDYYRTRNVARAKAALAGWDPRALKELLEQVEAESTSLEERQRLMELRGALGLMESGLLDSILGQKTVVFTVALAALPLITAVVIAGSPLVQRVIAGEAFAQGEVSEQEAESLFPEEQQSLDEMRFEEERRLAEEQGWERQGGEKPDLSAEEEIIEEEEEIIEEEDEQADTGVEGVLSGLFDDDPEEMGRLEALSKGLGDVDVNELLQLTQEVSGGLAALNERREYGQPHVVEGHRAYPSRVA